MALHHMALATLASTLYIAPAIASDSNPNSFDFVTIGGGTTGLAVANKLFEIPDITVAVIEAGKDERNNPNVTSVKGFGGGTGFNTHIDRLYEMTEQTHAGGRQLEYHSGKAWGGTSTINGWFSTMLEPFSSLTDLF
jgi:choline dehydrogenase-like flavoprotein